MILTLFLFILVSNAAGLIPIFEVVGLLDHYVLHTDSDSLVNIVLHGGTTSTANYNVTAALATITFFAIIIAGTMAHGFIGHWKNLVPPGCVADLHPADPDRDHGHARQAVRAHDAAGGEHDRRPHRDSLDAVAGVHLHEFFGAAIGLGVGFTVALPLAVGISALEVIVVMVQAYVFTLLTSVFIGMAINVHH